MYLKTCFKNKSFKAQKVLGVKVRPCVKFLDTIFMKSNLISSWQILTRKQLCRVDSTAELMHQKQNLKAISMSGFKFVSSKSVCFSSCIINLWEENKLFLERLLMGV